MVLNLFQGENQSPYASFLNHVPQKVMSLWILGQIKVHHVISTSCIQDENLRTHHTRGHVTLELELLSCQ